MKLGTASLLAACLIFVAVPARASGSASIFIGPSSGTFTVGSTFTISVYLNTNGNSVNAIEADLSFPADKLQVVSPTAGKSLIRVWVNQPTFSNSDGTLKFQGAVPNPGINTDSGVISTITFRVKSVGTATLKIQDSSKVLLNDGRGTDILGQTTDGLYYLVLPPPAGPIVTSPTNPDQEKWYTTKTVAFRWAVNPEAVGYSYILNDSPVDIPDDISEGVRDSVIYKDLPDGIHYFHIKINRGVGWGGVTDYAIKIDNTPPAAFKINISPSNYTSNQKPIIEFGTTDETSGINHYEIKFISLDSSKSNTPFFIEATSPYTQHFELGRYDVVVRAYDEAGNFYQTTERLTITKPIFEFITGRGLRIGGVYVSWVYTWIITLIILFFLFRFARFVWRLHRDIEEQISHGVSTHPQLVEKLKELQRKMQEYGKKWHVLILLAVLVGSLYANIPIHAAGDAAHADRVSLEPPVVTLFPKSISNDEIFYIGGRAGAPNAKVLIYLQESETGSTQNYVVDTDKTGAWFYSVPQFLTAGHYIVWTQLQVQEDKSPPSSRIDLAVAPTAIQIGTNRLNYQDFYLILMLIFGAAFLGVLGFTIYHSYHYQTKRRRLRKEIQEAEESVRRGFSILRRDIEAELAVVRKAKLSKELSMDERSKEDKLLKDLEIVSRYIGKEVWDIDELEKES